MSVQDVITNDEVATSTFELKEVDDIVYEVDTKFIIVREDAVGAYTLPLFTEGILVLLGHKLIQDRH